jgi:hypothetical protein
VSISPPRTRRDERHHLSPDLKARVEFDYPAGKRWRLQLVDLSVAGLAFALDRGQPRMECGSHLSDVLVHVGEAEMSGNLVILHVTRENEARTVCGALFHPSSPEDEARLKRVIESFAGAPLERCYDTCAT